MYIDYDISTPEKLAELKDIVSFGGRREYYYPNFSGAKSVRVHYISKNEINPRAFLENRLLDEDIAIDMFYKNDSILYEDVLPNMVEDGIITWEAINDNRIFWDDLSSYFKEYLLDLPKVVLLDILDAYGFYNVKENAFEVFEILE